MLDEKSRLYGISQKNRCIYLQQRPRIRSYCIITRTSRSEKRKKNNNLARAGSLVEMAERAKSPSYLVIGN